MRLSIDVSSVQSETSSGLISSIDEELQDEQDLKKRENLIILKDRLDYLSRANKAIMKSLTRQKNVEEIADLIKE